MKKQLARIGVLVVLGALMLGAPAHAIVIENVLSHHPLVAFVNTWASPSDNAVSAPPASVATIVDPASQDAGNLPVPPSPSVSKDNMTVEIVPISVPKLPTYVVFAIYLVGAMVFYTMLVLIAQPGPSEYV